MEGNSIVLGDRTIGIIVRDPRGGHGWWGDGTLFSLGETFDRLRRRLSFCGLKSRKLFNEHQTEEKHHAPFSQPVLPCAPLQSSPSLPDALQRS